jgi:hypothetical protein
MNVVELEEKLIPNANSKEEENGRKKRQLNSEIVPKDSFTNSEPIAKLMRDNLLSSSNKKQKVIAVWNLDALHEEIVLDPVVETIRPEQQHNAEQPIVPITLDDPATTIANPFPPPVPQFIKVGLTYIDGRTQQKASRLLVFRIPLDQALVDLPIESFYRQIREEASRTALPINIREVADSQFTVWSVQFNEWIKLVDMKFLLSSPCEQNGVCVRVKSF